jgi:hypothetical protein
MNKGIFQIILLTATLIDSSLCFSQHKNILISNKNSPEETTICINPKSPNIIVAAANTESYYFSSDTGRTWRDGSLKSSYGVWGDPCLLVDSAGSFYYFHLSKMSSGNPYDRLICQKSFNKGIDWTNGTFLGLNEDFSQDKEWAAIDPKTNYIYVLWTEQKKRYDREKTKTLTDINLSISKDLGKTWTKGAKINEKSGPDFDNWKTVIGAMPAIGPNRQVYATWVSHEGIYFDKSLDSGRTWMSKDVEVALLNEKWSISMPGMYRCYVFPIIACDMSNSKYKGNIYITWSDKKKDDSDTDILFSKSSDEGTTWSAPVKVNDDSTSRHQYLPWITIDQSNGYIYMIFYDRRNHKDNKTDVYMARSTDGGQTFVNFKINERSFTPKSYTFMGDYIGVDAYNNIVRPIWASMDDHENLSIWTAIINVNEIK